MLETLGYLGSWVLRHLAPEAVSEHLGSQILDALGHVRAIYLAHCHLPLNPLLYLLSI